MNVLKIINARLAILAIIALMSVCSCSKKGRSSDPMQHQELDRVVWNEAVSHGINTSQWRIVQIDDQGAFFIASLAYTPDPHLPGAYALVFIDKVSGKRTLRMGE